MKCRTWQIHVHLTRIPIAVAAIGLVLAAAVHLRHVNTTSVALVLVLAVLSIALTWEWPEALVAAIVAALGLDYFFLPPHGFGIARPEHWVAFAVFLVTAIAAGQLSARANRNRAEAVQRQREMEKLYRLGELISQGENADDTVQQLSDALQEILGVAAVAIYDNATGRMHRSGTRAGEMTYDRLRDVMFLGKPFEDPGSAISIVPVWKIGEPAGSIGIAGVGVSPQLLKAVAEKVGVALAKACIAESLKEAEISRRADELKSAIYDALAHEARGPLSSINIAATALLSEQPGNAAQQREMLSIIREEVGRMNQWIDEAARTSHTDTRTFTLKRGPQDVRELVSDALEPLQPLLRGRGVRVEIEEFLPTADCDAETTRRVLKLLLDNALKYTPPGTPITVSGRADHDEIVMSVSDSGPGIAKDEQARIFEKHYRGASHGSMVPGTGLGLASAKFLVEAQGGEIWVSNRPEGGAAFYFSVPAANGVMA